MNLIQLSEQLKEAPDNLLMQEVRAPTGSYPSYLIISELTRRKRLRDGAQQQQAPQPAPVQPPAAPAEVDFGFDETVDPKIAGAFKTLQTNLQAQLSDLFWIASN